MYFPIGSGTALFFKTVENAGSPKSWDRLIEVQVREVEPDVVDRLNVKMISQAESAVFGCYYDKEIQRMLTPARPTRFKVGSLGTGSANPPG